MWAGCTSLAQRRQPSVSGFLDDRPEHVPASLENVVAIPGSSEGTSECSSAPRGRSGGGFGRVATNDLHVVGVEHVAATKEVGRRGWSENEICQIGSWGISRQRENSARFERVSGHTQSNHHVGRACLDRPGFNLASVSLHVEIDNDVRINPFGALHDPRKRQWLRPIERTKAVMRVRPRDRQKSHAQRQTRTAVDSRIHERRLRRIKVTGQIL